MKFKIPVSWEMSGIIEIEANTLEKALEYFNINSDDIPLPDGEYVDSSFTVTGGEDVESIWELYNSQNDGLALAESNLVPYFSVWDGGIEIETTAKVDIRTGEVTNITLANVSGLNLCEREYIVMNDKQLDVCNDVYGYEAWVDLGRV